MNKEEMDAWISERMDLVDEKLGEGSSESVDEEAVIRVIEHLHGAIKLGTEWGLFKIVYGLGWIRGYEAGKGEKGE